MKMPFGKYKNEDLVDIPIHYLKWVEENVRLDPILRKAINFEIERREGDRPGQGFVTPKINIK